MGGTTLTFLGTGTSQGVPVISCRCQVCTSTDDHDKRLRASALVECHGVVMVIDAGPDFRQQMLRQDVRHLDAILLTHEHKDHIAGLDDVRAFNYTSGVAIDIYAARRVQRVVRKDFDYAFAVDRYPGVPDMNLVEIDHEPFVVAGVQVIPVRGMHYRLPVLGFRIGGLAYLTDFNRIDEMEIDKIKGVEVLVINALRRQSHVSHFSLEQALGIAARVGARRTYLTHLSHQIGLHADLATELPEGVYPAYDGLSITLE